MSRYSRSHLSDPDLRRDLRTHSAQERGVTAVVLADIAEFDRRKLYRPDGYSSMFAYCVQALGYSEDAAYARIQAARAARRFPAIFDWLADGRLHLTAVRLLGPHLTRDNVQDLLAGATHKTKAQVETLLAERFPRPDLAPMLRALPASAPSALGRVETPAPAGLPIATVPACEPLPEPATLVSQDSNVQNLQGKLVPERVESAKLAPLAPQRFGVQFTIDEPTRELLQHVQELLGHGAPSNDLADVFRRGLTLLARELERNKFSACAKPRPQAERRSKNPRHIPAHVKREVWKRDQGQCTFVGTNGHRCEARTQLEFDHELPVARGGRSGTSNVRLRCRAHNQYQAEQTFGAGFMQRKRERAREAMSGARSAP